MERKRKERWDRGVDEKERGRKNEKGKRKGEKNKEKQFLYLLKYV